MKQTLHTPFMNLLCISEAFLQSSAVVTQIKETTNKPSYITV